MFLELVVCILSGHVCCVSRVGSAVCVRWGKMAGDAGVKALHAIEKLMRGCECEVKEEVLAEQKVAYKHQIELEMMHNEECLAKMILGDRIGVFFFY